MSPYAATGPAVLPREALEICAISYNCFTFLFILFAKRVDVIGSGANPAAGGLVTNCHIEAGNYN